MPKPMFEESDYLRELQPGQFVTAYVYGDAVDCVVVDILERSLGTGIPQEVSVRRMGKTKTGALFRSFRRSSYQLNYPRNKAEKVRANIFADWLDDHNFPEAAVALRQAFPLIPLEE